MAVVELGTICCWAGMVDWEDGKALAWLGIVVMVCKMFGVVAIAKCSSNL
jgi:hypothetical protein